MWKHAGDKQLFQTADQRRIVEAGDPDAAILLASPGDEFSDDDAERLGLKAYKGAVETKAMGEGPDQPQPEPQPEPDEEDEEDKDKEPAQRRRR